MFVTNKKRNYCSKQFIQNEKEKNIRIVLKNLVVTVSVEAGIFSLSGKTY